MFSNLRNRITGLEEYVVALEKRLTSLEEELKDESYLEWKRMRDANEKEAAKSGQWFLSSKTDVQLLQQIIQKINQDPDLAAMLRTSDGTTLTLRTYPVSLNEKINKMNKFAEEE